MSDLTGRPSHQIPNLGVVGSSPAGRATYTIGAARGLTALANLPVGVPDRRRGGRLPLSVIKPTLVVLSRGMSVRRNAQIIVRKDQLLHVRHQQLWHDSRAEEDYGA